MVATPWHYYLVMQNANAPKTTRLRPCIALPDCHFVLAIYAPVKLFPAAYNTCVDKTLPLGYTLKSKQILSRSGAVR